MKEHRCKSCDRLLMPRELCCIDDDLDIAIDRHREEAPRCVDKDCRRYQVRRSRCEMHAHALDDFEIGLDPIEWDLRRGVDMFGESVF